ncbi:hypothetical protein HJFPF1_03153 [Paramyrothecium foliicola]|nr:hypothetical protein HJFPF1_03153 [Paramyrothecium foliicola]
MADPEADRPTFETFWKEGKQKTRDTQIAFINTPVPKQESTSPKESSDASPDQSNTLDKAQLRRAQVRRAQIQHRQRKAEYINKLEEDVAHYREIINRAERQSQFLSKENDFFKEKLRQTVSSHAVSRATAWSHQQAEQQQQQQQHQPQPVLPPTPHMSIPLKPDPEFLTQQFEAQALHDTPGKPSTESNNELFGDIDVGALNITLSVDDVLGTPCFNVSSASPGASSYGATSPAESEAGISNQLTPAQEQMAVNFILAGFVTWMVFDFDSRLEHVCWDHFTEEHTIDVEKELEGAFGHTLMASAYCMAQAPESVFSEIEHLSTQPESSPKLQWTGEGISLKTLHGLALSITNADVEITPVQAWFELARRYPVSLLVDPHIMASLKRQLKSVVRCVYYGAVMDRDAFEVAVDRVLGSVSTVAGPTFM